MKIIGVTGGLACGKTTVARIFAELGAKVLDADEIAHEVVLPKTEPWEQIVRSFGQGVLARDQTIDRDKLAQIVFSSTKALKRLERIVHPVVVNEIIKRLDQIRKKKCTTFAVIDAPLLIESRLNRIVDELVVVKVDRQRQIERIISQGKFTRDQAAKRIEHQMPLAKKIEVADYVVDNNGSLGQTRRQVERIWREIQQKTNQ